jgi:DNA-binding NarL/FixJ family response regulator
MAQRYETVRGYLAEYRVDPVSPIRVADGGFTVLLMSIGYPLAEAEIVSHPEPILCSRCHSEVSGSSNLPAVALTPQELGVLRLYASGTTMYSVARELGIAPSSVATYIKRIRKKYANAGIQLSSKVDLNRVARETGLID